MKIPFSRSAPARLLRYLNKRNRRPTLPGGLTTYYEKSGLSVDEKIVMMYAKARDQKQAREALTGFESASQWVASLPPSEKRWKARFVALIRRALGLYDYDPMQNLNELPRRKSLNVKYRLESEYVE